MAFGFFLAIWDLYFGFTLNDGQFFFSVNINEIQMDSKVKMFFVVATVIYTIYIVTNPWLVGW